jgi:hypothetical protein
MEVPLARRLDLEQRLTSGLRRFDPRALRRYRQSLPNHVVNIASCRSGFAPQVKHASVSDLAGWDMRPGNER